MPKNNSQVVCFTPLTRPLPPTHTHTHTVLSVRTTQTKQEIHPFSILCSFCLKWTFETSQWQIFYKKKESLSDCNHPQSAVHVPRSIAGISHLTKCFFFFFIFDPQQLGSSFPHSWFDVLGKTGVIVLYHTAPLCFIPTGISTNKHFACWHGPHHNRKSPPSLMSPQLVWRLLAALPRVRQADSLSFHCD